MATVPLSPAAELRPRRGVAGLRCSGAGRAAAGPKRGQQHVGVAGMRAEAGHGGHRTKRAVQVVEVRLVVRRADRRLLPHAVERPPQAAVVPQHHARCAAVRGITLPSNRVLRGRHAGGRRAAVLRVGGIAQTAAAAQSAAKEVLRPNEQERIRHAECGRRRYRGKRQVVITLRDFAACLHRRRVDARAPLHACRRADAAGRVACVLPKTLVVVPRIHCQREQVAGDRLRSQRSAKDGTARRAVIPRTRGTGSRCQSRAGLVGHARKGDAISRLVVAVRPHRRVEPLPHRVPHHRCRRVAAIGVDV